MTNVFVPVQVEEHEALPDGCSMRFRAAGEPSVVHRVVYEPEDGEESTWDVRGENADGSSTPAVARLVDDSSAGTSMLVVGGSHGLRLVSANRVLALPYLLLAPSALLP